MSLGRIVNRLMNSFGYAVTKMPPRHDLPEMQTDVLVDRLRNELAETAAREMNEFLPDLSLKAAELRTMIDDFYSLFNQRPIQDNQGGSGFQSMFWLYLVTRCLDPRLIVESGVWRGQSSWLFRQVCPEAEMHCFDISLDRLEVKDASIHFHERDWMERETIAPEAENSLIFFDCHVNQGLRIHQAYQRGFRYLLLDDNVPADTIYFDGTPALPSVNMIMDPEISDGMVLNWTFNGKPRSFTYKDKDTHGAADLIEYWHRLPNVAPRCGYPGLSYLSVVRLRSQG